MNEELQLEIINVIEILESEFDSQYQKNELEQLRKKYIFKDVPNSEMVRDVKYLKALKAVTLLKIN